MSFIEYSKSTSDQHLSLYGNLITNIAGTGLVLMSGPVPTLSEFNAGTPPSTRTGTDGTWGSQILCRWASPGTSLFSTPSSGVDGRQIIFSNLGLRAPALASGVATWWMFFHTTSTFAGWAIMGDVGLPNSGASMGMLDTNVVAGQQCLLGSFKFIYPHRFEW